MNWREHPQLFANGQFSLWYAPRKQVVGYHGITEHFFRGKYDNKYSGRVEIRHSVNHISAADIKDCTLIARKIEDMTDEEYNKRDQIIYTVRDGVYGMVKFRDESPESFLYLLSIGVYPFDQSHFEDGTVIKKETE